ncbi:DUF3616 domain-containing protein [Pontibacter sp. MBLB2868]|uniref:DUF3616 domain-containing protein n=1 Tax=Pontibacter sp. MBLB2868 TaxID=3451555 RepID=UPI003F7516D2
MTTKITLEFDHKISLTPDGKHVRDGLSTALRTGDNLWLSCDERTAVERLTLTAKGTFAQHASFRLSDYLDLPGQEQSEVDIEGMGAANGYMWIMGSHSLKRKKPKRHASIQKQIKQLADIKNDANRYLLARIPMIQDKESGQFTLYKEVEDPEQEGRLLRAAQLHGDKTSSILSEILLKDEHLAPFMTIPGKDNGFDVEGLAVFGNRLFIGLRGPVLRGWAVVLEVEPEEDKKGKLHLKELGNGRLYRKHFLNLRGKGIRELRVFGDDMYLLAGPTMDLDGVIAIYRWPNAVKQEKEQLLHNNELERIGEVPHGTGENTGKDKGEGLAFFDEKHVLVVFDSPVEERKVGKDAVQADLIRVIS